MSNLNIFQSSNSMIKVVADVLGYEFPQEHSWFTQDMYFETFFYLTKRFGLPLVVDEYKQVSYWDFKVKYYSIRIELNSSWVTFMVFGNKKIFNQSTHPVVWIKRNRETKKKIKLLVDIHKPAEKRTKFENKKLQDLLNEFQVEKGISNDSITEQEWDKKYASDFWLKKVEGYNDSIIDVKREDYEKYDEYMFAEKKHALRTLRQFLNNMLTPIWIRDCPFNIKGRLTDEQSILYRRYHDNISIVCENKTKPNMAK